MIYIERFLKYCIVVAMTVMALEVEGKTIYVSSSEGTETNNGLTASAPINTIAAALAMGDTILLKAGDVFYETIECRNKYISRYGEGHNPTLSGFKRIRKPNWEQVEPNIWRLKLNSDNFTGFTTHKPFVNNIGCIHDYDNDQIHGRRLQLRHYLKENWDFYQTSNHKKGIQDSEFDYIYLYLEADPNLLHLEFSVGLAAAMLEDTKIDNLFFTGYGQGLVCKSNVTVSNCRIDAIGGRCYLNELDFCSQGSGVEVDANEGVTNCWVSYCYITRCYEAGVSILASYQNKIPVDGVSISNNLIAKCGRGFEIVMSNVTDVNFEDCAFVSNTVLDSGNSGFGYTDQNFSTSHVFMDYGMKKTKFIVDGNIFVKGNLYLSSMSSNNGQLSDWHNNTCYLLPTDVMIGSLFAQRGAITVSRAGKLKDAVKMFKEESGDKSTRFVLCDEAQIEKELFREAEQKGK